MLVKFPSLETFNKVFARETYTLERRSISYQAKIKLHGTNIGIRIEPDGSVSSQGHNSDITIEDDLHDFAAWFEPQKTFWARLSGSETLTVYGEWAGPGIAKGDAIQKTDKKRFFIFALGIGAVAHPQNDNIMIPEWVITDPAAILDRIGGAGLPDDVIVLPYEGEEPLIFDFSDEKEIEKSLEILNASVDMVALVDPYVSRTFGISHPGEGFVLIPISRHPGELSGAEYARIAFKAKTAKHRVQKARKPASAREPLPKTAHDLIDTFCTPQRVTQAVEEVCGGVADKKATGRVIAWVAKDIQKEAADEISALGLDFPRLKGEIANATRGHFMQMLPAEHA